MSLDHIPITFTHEGKEYTGHFSEVHGGGGNTWHLSINKYYWGRLRLNDQGWFFDPTPHDPSWTELADFFGEYITLWYE